MKKAKNAPKPQAQTGLERTTPKGKTARMSQKPRGGKKAPKTPKSAAPTAEKPKRKQGGKGQPFREKPWGDYAKGNKPMNKYTTEELKEINRRAAKAANARLRALEKAGLTSYVYKRAYKLVGQTDETKKPRFKERTDKMSLQELRAQFAALRDFMTAKTSTVSGYRTVIQGTYENAVKLGFKGDFETLSFMYSKYMTEEMESLLGSDVIYEEITSGRASDGSLDTMIKQFQDKNERARRGGDDSDRSQGRALLEALRKHGRKRT